MPPRRRLTDLCQITVFKILTPNNQLKGAKMSPRSAILVRDANRKVKTLIIASSNDFDSEKIEATINKNSLASKPSMQLLPAGGQPSFPDYPMTTRVNKWNCLQVDDSQLLDEASAEQIVNAFPAVTDLKLCNVSTENLIALLQRPQWAKQLVSLAVFRQLTSLSTYRHVDLSTEPRLIAALNALSALQCLGMALEWNSDSELPNLNILAQLKMAAFDVKTIGSAESATFLRSLDRQTEGVDDLQVYLNTSNYYGDGDLLFLSEPFCSRIVRYDELILNLSFGGDVSLFGKFSSLTSVTVYCKEAPQLEALFTALAQLNQLVHLKLILLCSFSREVEEQLTEHQPQPFRRPPPAQLTSVQALEVEMVGIRSHSQMPQWVNLLPVTLPRLLAIHIGRFECQSCGVELSEYLEGGYSKGSKPSISFAFKCLRATLPLIHPDFPHSQIILGGYKPYPTLDQLLSAKQ